MGTQRLLSNLSRDAGVKVPFPAVIPNRRGACEGLGSPRAGCSLSLNPLGPRLPLPRSSSHSRFLANSMELGKPPCPSHSRCSRPILRVIPALTKAAGWSSTISLDHCGKWDEAIRDYPIH